MHFIDVIVLQGEIIMLIYNITTKVDWLVANAWIEWMQREHIPGIIETGCFTEHRLVRLLEVDDADGPTYAVQFNSPTQTEYDYYIQHYATTFRKKSMERWGDKSIAFHSLMEVIE